MPELVPNHAHQRPRTQTVRRNEGDTPPREGETAHSVPRRLGQGGAGESEEWTLLTLAREPIQERGSSGRVELGGKPHDLEHDGHERCDRGLEILGSGRLVKQDAQAASPTAESLAVHSLIALSAR
jgi:hypothetical protein